MIIISIMLLILTHYNNYDHDNDENDYDVDIPRERVGFSIGSRQVDDRRNTDTGVFIFINVVINVVIIMNIIITVMIIIILVEACSKLCQRQGCRTFAYRFLIKNYDDYDDDDANKAIPI